MGNPLLDDGRYPDWAAGNPVGTERVENVSSSDGRPFDPIVFGRNTTQSRFNNLLDQAQIVSGAVGSLGGVRARFADANALAEAMAMRHSGELPRTIVQRTGWWQNPQKEWKFEIPDNNMLLKVEPHNADLPQKGYVASPDLKEVGLIGSNNLTLGQVIQHPELFKQYPALKKVLVGAEGNPANLGSWTPAEHKIRMSPDWLPTENVMGTLGHEITHAIQSFEGWQNGSSPANHLPKNYQALADAHTEAAKRVTDMAKEKNIPAGQLDELLTAAKWVAEGKFSPKNPVFMDFSRFMAENPEMGRHLLEAGEKRRDLARANEGAYRDYRATTGEADANAVAKRLWLSPAARKATPFWEHYDIPGAQQLPAPILPWSPR